MRATLFWLIRIFFVLDMSALFEFQSITHFLFCFWAIIYCPSFLPQKIHHCNPRNSWRPARPIHPGRPFTDFNGPVTCTCPSSSVLRPSLRTGRPSCAFESVSNYLRRASVPGPSFGQEAVACRRHRQRCGGPLRALQTAGSL